jgi:hypothetical protein
MSPRSAPHHDYNYHHDVLDYWPGSPAGGCSSCGGSQGLGGRELMNVFVERVHRYRDMTQEACAFGPGVFCNYDVSLVFNPIQAQQQQGQPPPAVFYSVELFDPLEVEPKFYTEGSTNTGNSPMPTPTGIYTDTNSLSIKNLQCYDANNNFVVDPLTASSAVITNWPGYKSTFDIINLGGYAPSPTGWWRFEETSGTSAADASGNGNTGTLVNTPTRIVGKIGNALQFNGTNQSVSLVSYFPKSLPRKWINEWSNGLLDASDGIAERRKSCQSSCVQRKCCRRQHPSRWARRRPRKPGRWLARKPHWESTRLMRSCPIQMCPMRCRPPQMPRSKSRSGRSKSPGSRARAAVGGWSSPKTISAPRSPPNSGC